MAPPWKHLWEESLCWAQATDQGLLPASAKKMLSRNCPVWGTVSTFPTQTCIRDHSCISSPLAARSQGVCHSLSLRLCLYCHCTVKPLHYFPWVTGTSSCSVLFASSFNFFNPSHRENANLAFLITQDLSLSSHTQLCWTDVLQLWLHNDPPQDLKNIPITQDTFQNNQVKIPRV